METHDSHLSPAGLEGVQANEIEELSQPNISGVQTGETSQVLQNSDGEVGDKGVVSANKKEVKSSPTKPQAKTSKDFE
ncbi:uncharacterized protein LOC129895995 isoform X2 [Solanum dulcamara]|nr:uncharacterized protein LOC129895995 isoform X2 [Solanum dulcamara]